MEKKLIQPRVLKGFRDYLPEIMLNRKRLLYKIENLFESFGFAPIDTPVLEYSEILLGKGGEESDKQLYRFNDHGDRDVTMRFDLTVPLARFTAQHYNELGMPFKAYHTGLVWRGENTHKGRYREFYQCDFDILGTNSNFSDIEIVTLIFNSIKELIGSDEFTIRINNRMVLNGLMSALGLQDKTAGILRVIDKINKVSREKLIEEMIEKNEITGQQTEEILDFIGIKGSNQEIISSLEERFKSNDTAMQGIANLREMTESLRALGIPEKCFQIDLSIARGLDYYTGSVFETILEKLPGIGSICSGGRYDNLASLYTANSIPGVGASIGIDRLIAAMEELNLLTTGSTPARVLVTAMDKNYRKEYLRLAGEIRAAGIKTELFTDDKKFDKQLKYANRKGFDIVLIMGENEIKAGNVNLKVMKTGENISVEQAVLIEKLHSLLK